MKNINNFKINGELSHGTENYCTGYYEFHPRVIIKEQHKDENGIIVIDKIDLISCDII